MYYIDPEAMKNRKEKKLIRCIMNIPGSNFMWSIDEYDKLQHCGFYIHGTIDAYSRYIIWLEADTTNKKSIIILKYYLDTIKQIN
ncbi:557_t:CDS:1, partial [Racocetra persica]